MIKFWSLFILLLFSSVSRSFAQWPDDGSYLWNVVNISYPVNEKTNLLLNFKEQYNNQTDRNDFFHIELTAYRKLSSSFSMGLGYRQTESYKADTWLAGHNYLLYGVFMFSPANLKIKFANRIVYKSFRNTDSQVGFDNITNIDFFAKSKSKIPKPYIGDEVFSELKSMKLQHIRLYFGFHLLKKEHFAFDVFYCDLFVNSELAWKNFNVYGINTKINI